MGDLVQLDERRPHAMGFVVCFAAGCGYAWTCVYPAGADEDAMHCPQCGESVGRVVDEPAFDAALLAHRRLHGITAHSAECHCGQGHCR